MAHNFRSKGGHARAASLTPERRSEIARNAAIARHGKAHIGKLQEERHTEMTATTENPVESLIIKAHELALQVEKILVEGAPNYRVGLAALVENVAAGIVASNDGNPAGVALDIQAFISLLEAQINAQLRKQHTSARAKAEKTKSHEDKVTQQPTA